MAGEQKCEKKLVESLTGLVNAAKGFLDAADAATVNSRENEKEDLTVENSLKRLFPSTRGRKGVHRDQTTTTSTSSTMSTNEHSTVTAEQGWGSGSSFRKRKFAASPFNSKKSCGSASKTKKGGATETLKDIFLINDPGKSVVPRRNERQYYYQNNLVASAVRFKSIMSETDIRIEILLRFSHFKDFDFVFLKAVDDALIEPTVENWDYATMKHVTGQGPLYIRSIKKLAVEFDDVYDEDGNENDETGSDHGVKKSHGSFPCKRLTQNDPVLDESKPCCSNSGDVSLSQSKKNNPLKICDYFVKTIACPICYRKFPCDVIEEHASLCSERFDAVFNILESDEDNADDTVAYDRQFSCTTEEKADFVSEESMDLKSILTKLSNEQKLVTTQALKVRRKFVWSDFCAHLKKPWVSGMNNFVIQFVGEPSVDTGGPRREFFNVCLKQMAESLLQNGNPVKSIMLVNERLFYYAGRLMALSLVQGGPNPAILSAQSYKYVSSAKVPSPKDYNIPPYFLEEDMIKKILAAETDQAFQNTLMEDDVMDLLSKIGYRGLPSKEKLHSRDDIVRSMFYKDHIEPIVPALQQLVEGLDIHNLVNLIRTNAHMLSTCFIGKEIDLTLEIFNDLWEANFSEKGSIKYEKEVNVYKYFTDVLEYCYHCEKSEFELKDLLQFLTGSSSIPPLGFEKKISINFLHDCEPVRGRQCECLPVVSTCALELTIPVHVKDNKELETVLTYAIRGCYGFGRL